MSETLVPLLAGTDTTRVDVTTALDRLRMLAVTPHIAAGRMGGLIGVLVPAVADRCVVELVPTPDRDGRDTGPVAPVLLTTSGAGGSVMPATSTAGAHAMTVSFASPVDQAFHGTVSCGWEGSYAPSAHDRAVVQAIVDQCVLLADRVHLAEGVQQLQTHAGQLRTAVESNRRIGAAIGILMVRYGLTEDGAFDALRRTSNTANRKLRDVADEVLYTGALPERVGGRSGTAR